MRNHWWKSLVLAWTLLTCSAVGSLAVAGTNVVSEDEILGTMNARERAETADRQVIANLLARPEVRDVASHSGLDLQRAQDAVGSLTGDELQQLADQARIAQADLAGGDTLFISATTIIIVLLIVILLVAVD